MNPERKLRRGLSDISPLFSPKKPVGEAERSAKADVEHKTRAMKVTVGKPEQGEGAVHCLSVMNPDNPQDSFFLNSFLASQIASEENFCSVISLDSRHFPRQDLTKRRSSPESVGQHMKRSHLTWDEFEKICNQPVMPSSQRRGRRQAIFLDIDYAQVPRFERVLPVLDKWVLVVQPQVESIKNAYKMIKGALTLNSHLEYYLIFEGAPNEKRDTFLFERFSAMLTEKLGVNLSWLGYLETNQKGNPSSHPISLESLFMKTGDKISASNKFALADHMVPYDEKSVGSVL